MNCLISSFKKNLKGISIIFLSSILVSIGQLFWKLSNGSDYSYLILGFICYGMGAVLMIVGFKFGSFSVLHPMLCTGYIVSLIIGYFYLGEPVGIFKVLGVMFIIIGVVFVGGGDG